MEEIYWLICPGGGSLPISFLSSHIPCSQEKEGLSELREYCAHIVRAWDCALGGASEFRACSGWPQEAGLERCPVGEDSSSFIKPFCVSAFPGDSAGKESAYSAGDLGSIPGLGMTWRRVWQPTPVFLPGESPRTEEPGRLQSMEFSRPELWSG